MEENEKRIDNIGDALEEIGRLRRLLKRKEQDIQTLSRFNESSEQLRKHHDGQLKLQYLYTDLLLANCPNMIFLFDEELRFAIGSRACSFLSGAPSSELANKPFPQVFSDDVDARWIDKIYSCNRDVLRLRGPMRFDDTIRMQGDEIIHVQVSISPIIDERNVCRGTIMSITDVSELVLARGRAEAAANAKSSFLANMSHELRTSMNAVKGLSELLSYTQLNELQRNYVENIVEASDALITIINDVLDFSKIDANRIEIVNDVYSIPKLLTEICSVVGTRAEQQGLLFLVDADPNMPARLIGDDMHIKQILVNLLSNAVKYTPAGRVVFSIRLETKDGETMLVCQVEDSGIGIREDDMPLLFEAFSRVDLKANRAIRGTGLGLAICKQLAHVMGGDVHVVSTYGRGSRFTLALPQSIHGDSRLATVDNPGSMGVLLADTGPRMDNVKAMLEQLGVRSSFIEDVGGGSLFPGEGGEAFSHCIYTDAISARELVLLRSSLPGCRFVLLGTIFSAGDDDGRSDPVLFAPLLVTELAKFLNRSIERDRDDSDGQKTAKKLRCRDTVALVVDDNRINLMVCEKMLSIFGVEVVTAQTGRQALELCGDRKFDIIFLDHMMPEMDGVEVAAEIRLRPGSNEKAPIVALTANVMNDMRSFCKCPVVPTLAHRGFCA